MESIVRIKEYSKIIYKCFSCLLSFIFFVTIVFSPSLGYTQVPTRTVLDLPAPGIMLSMSAGFIPTLIKGVTVYPDNPLQFDFIIDTGDANLEGEALTREAIKLIKYFLASLTVPEDELWVNLSPYEDDRIISEGLGNTVMGRDMLGQDYLLKQLTASLTYPETGCGNEFWQRVYKKAYEAYGTTDIPLNTFNKIWIMPDKAVVYAHGGSAFVVERHLNVMLEEDYFALQKSLDDMRFEVDKTQKENAEILSGISAQVVREILIPEIEKEVNEGKNFAQLQQIYNSMILATWYKKNLKESLFGQMYLDKNKTKGVDVEDKRMKEKIYEQYLAAFKQGVYDFIKEDYDPVMREVIPRKYFSGGLNGIPEGAYLELDGALQSQSREVQKAVQIEEGEKLKFKVNLYGIRNKHNPEVLRHVEDQAARKIYKDFSMLSDSNLSNMGPNVKNERDYLTAAFASIGIPSKGDVTFDQLPSAVTQTGYAGNGIRITKNMFGSAPAKDDSDIKSRQFQALINDMLRHGQAADPSNARQASDEYFSREANLDELTLLFQAYATFGISVDEDYLMQLVKNLFSVPVIYKLVDSADDIDKMFALLSGLSREWQDKLLSDPYLMLINLKILLFIRDKGFTQNYTGLLTQAEIQEFYQEIAAHEDEQSRIVKEMMADIQPLVVAYTRQREGIGDDFKYAPDNFSNEELAMRFAEGKDKFTRLFFVAPVLDLTLEFMSFDDQNELPDPQEPVFLTGGSLDIGGFGNNAAGMFSNLRLGERGVTIGAYPKGGDLEALFNLGFKRLEKDGVDTTGAYLGEGVPAKGNIYFVFKGGGDQTREEYLTKQGEYTEELWKTLMERIRLSFEDVVEQHLLEDVQDAQDFNIVAAYGGRFFSLEELPYFNSHLDVIKVLRDTIKKMKEKYPEQAKRKKFKGGVEIDYSSRWSREGTLELVEDISENDDIPVGIHFNRDEFIGFLKKIGFITEARVLERTKGRKNQNDHIAYMMRKVMEKYKNLFLHVTLGGDGIMLGLEGEDGPEIGHIAQPIVDDIISATGAGDSTIAALLIFEEYLRFRRERPAAFKSKEWWQQFLSFLAACGISTAKQPGTKKGTQADVDFYRKHEDMKLKVYKTEADFGDAQAQMELKEPKKIVPDAKVKGKIDDLRRRLLDMDELEESGISQVLGELEFQAVEDSDMVADGVFVDDLKKTEMAKDGVFLHSLLLNKAEGKLVVGVRIEGRPFLAEVDDQEVKLTVFNPYKWLEYFRKAGGRVNWVRPDQLLFERQEEEGQIEVSKQRLEKLGWNFFVGSFEPVSDLEIEAFVKSAKKANVPGYRTIADTMASPIKLGDKEFEPGYAHPRRMKYLVADTVMHWIFEGALKSSHFVGIIPDLDHFKSQRKLALSDNPRFHDKMFEAVEDIAQEDFEYLHAFKDELGLPEEFKDNFHLCADPSDLVLEIEGEGSEVYERRYRFLIHYLGHLMMLSYQQDNRIPLSYTANLFEYGLWKEGEGRAKLTGEEVRYFVGAMKEKLQELSNSSKFEDVPSNAVQEIMDSLTHVTGPVGRSLHGLQPKAMYDVDLGTNPVAVSDVNEVLVELGLANEIHATSNNDPWAMELLKVVPGNNHARLATDLISSKNIALMLHAPEVALSHLPLLLSEPRIISGELKKKYKALIDKIVDVKGTGDDIHYEISQERLNMLLERVKQLVEAIEDKQVYYENNLTTDPLEKLEKAHQFFLRLYYSDIANKDKMSSMLEEVKDILGKDIDQEEYRAVLSVLHFTMAYSRYVTAIREGVEAEMAPFDRVSNLPSAVRKHIVEKIEQMIQYHFELFNAQGSSRFLTDASLTDDLEQLSADTFLADKKEEVINKLLNYEDPDSIITDRRVHMFLHLIANKVGEAQLPEAVGQLLDNLAERLENPLEIEAYLAVKRNEGELVVDRLDDFGFDYRKVSFNGEDYVIFNYDRLTETNYPTLALNPPIGYFKMNGQIYHIAKDTPINLYYRIFQMAGDGKEEDVLNRDNVAKALNKPLLFHGLTRGVLSIDKRPREVVITFGTEDGKARKVRVSESPEAFEGLEAKVYKYGLIDFYVVEESEEPLNYRKIVEQERADKLITSQSVEPLGNLASEEEILDDSFVKGGVDFNPALLDLQVNRDDNGVPLPLPQQSIEIMDIQGFIPVIIDVTPVNIQFFLGLDLRSSDEITQFSADTPVDETKEGVFSDKSMDAYIRKEQEI